MAGDIRPDPAFLARALRDPGLLRKLAGWTVPGVDPVQNLQGNPLLGPAGQNYVQDLLKPRSGPPGPPVVTPAIEGTAPIVPGAAPGNVFRQRGQQLEDLIRQAGE